MNRYLLKVNGELHCPDGICRPKSASEWEGGSVLTPVKGPSLARKGPHQAAPAIQRGDELWVWTHEDDKFGRGLGLTAKATAGDQVQDGDHNSIKLHDVTLMPRPFGLRELLPNTDDVETGSRLLDHINDDRWFNAFLIEDDDYADFIAVVNRMSAELPDEVRFEFAEGWEFEVLKHKDSLLDGLRNRRLTSQKGRSGQSKFRDSMMKRYRRRCIITNCSIPEALEAAHVMPHTGDQKWDHPDNGLLLRRDLHSLFDAMLWSIDPKSSRLRVADRLKSTSYRKLDGREIKHAVARPLLEVHFRQFQKAD